MLAIERVLKACPTLLLEIEIDGFKRFWQTQALRRLFVYKSHKFFFCDNAVIIDVAVALFFRHKAFFYNIFLAFWMEPTRKFLFKWSPVV